MPTYTQTTIKPDSPAGGFPNWTLIGAPPSQWQALQDAADGTAIDNLASNRVTAVQLGQFTLPADERVRGCFIRVRREFRAAGSQAYGGTALRGWGGGEHRLFEHALGNKALAWVQSALFPTTSDGREFTQAILNDLSLHFYSGGAAGRFRVAEAEVIVQRAGRPTVSSVSVTGQTVTARPTVSVGYSDPNDDEQDGLRVRVFTSDVFSAAGFDPETSREAVWDSGIIAGSVREVQIGVPLEIGKSYRAYASVAKILPARGRWWSAWGNGAFSLTFTPPPTPSVVRTIDADRARVRLAVTQRANLLTLQDASLEDTANVGSWVPVTNCTLSNSAVTALHGVRSLLVTPVTVGVGVPAVARTATQGGGRRGVREDDRLTALAYFRSGSSNDRAARVGIEWLNAFGVPISTEWGGNVIPVTTTAVWVPGFVVGTAPAGARQWRVLVQYGTVSLTGPGMTLHVDQMAAYHGEPDPNLLDSVGAGQSDPTLPTLVRSDPFDTIDGAYWNAANYNGAGVNSVLDVDAGPGVDNVLNMPATSYAGLEHGPSDLRNTRVAARLRTVPTGGSAELLMLTAVPGNDVLWQWNNGNISAAQRVGYGDVNAAALGARTANEEHLSIQALDGELDWLASPNGTRWFSYLRAPIATGVDLAAARPSLATNSASSGVTQWDDYRDDTLAGRRTPWYAHSNCRIGFDTAVKLSPERSLALRSLAAGDASIRSARTAADRIPAGSGERLTLAVTAQCVTTARVLEVGIVYLRRDGTVISIDVATLNPGANGRWVQMQVQGSCPSGTASVEVQLGVQGTAAAGEVMLYDNLRLVRGPSTLLYQWGPGSGGDAAGSGAVRMRAQAQRTRGTNLAPESLSRMGTIDYPLVHVRVPEDTVELSRADQREGAQAVRWTMGGEPDSVLDLGSPAQWLSLGRAPVAPPGRRVVGKVWARSLAGPVTLAADVESVASGGHPVLASPGPDTVVTADGWTPLLTGEQLVPDSATTLRVSVRDVAGTGAGDVLLDELSIERVDAGQLPGEWTPGSGDRDPLGWVDLRETGAAGEDSTLLPAGGVHHLSDFEAPYGGGQALYRVRAEQTVGGVVVASEWVEVAAYLPPDTTDLWHVKVPERPELNLRAFVEARSDQSAAEQVDVVRLLGRSLAVPVAVGLVGGEDGALEIVSIGEREWRRLRDAVFSQQVLLVQSPGVRTGDGFDQYVRVDARSWAVDAASGGLLRRPKLRFVQVEAP